MSPARSSSSQGMEENLKKAVIEMLVLLLLNQEDMHSVQITQALEERSDGDEPLLPLCAAVPPD